MNLTEATWFYYSNGFIAEADMEGWRASICSRVSTPGGKQYWKREAKYFADSFRNAIDHWCF
jgi:hypothetical protein